MPQEIKINVKKTIICIVLVFLLFFGGFLTGRFVRLKGISGDSGKLIEGIVLGRDLSNSLLDRLGISRSAGQSAADLGRAVSRGIEELQRSNEVQQLCISSIIREVTDTQQNLELIKSALDENTDAIQLGFRIAEEQALAYERIINTLQQSDYYPSKDEQESIAGSRDSK